MTNKLLEIISEALNGEEISIDSTVESSVGWDSLGHLSILSALDDASGGKIGELREFNDVKSAKEIKALLTKFNIEI
jgi:acyl carrier protein